MCSKMSLTQLCSILMALCCDIGSLARAELSPLPVAVNSGRTVDADAFSLLYGQSVGRLSKQHCCFSIDDINDTQEC